MYFRHFNKQKFTGDIIFLFYFLEARSDEKGRESEGMGNLFKRLQDLSKASESALVALAVSLSLSFWSRAVGGHACLLGTVLQNVFVYLETGCVLRYGMIQRGDVKDFTISNRASFWNQLHLDAPITFSNPPNLLLLAFNRFRTHDA